jgi:hypothetical protein
MTAVRGNANQSHYLAAIVLDGWRLALESDDVSAATVTLTQAYLPAVREHLLAAYGWFLLEIAGVTDWTGAPPRRCDDLPPVPPGKATAGELRECLLLESQGFLGELLVEPDFSRPAPASRGNLATPAVAAPDCETARRWHAELGALMSRMRDSLDEY